MTKNTKIIIGIIIVVLIISGIWYGINKDKSEKEVIKIGAILPLTGKAANFGGYVKNGLDLALEEVVKDGNVKMDLIYQDEKCDPKEAVSAYQNLKFQGVRIIIGAFCSPSTLAMAPLAEKDKILLITPASSAPSISQAGDFIFRNHSNSDFEYSKLADMAIKKYKKLGVIYDNTNDTFIAGQKAFADEFKSKEGEILASISFKGGSMDYRTELTKIKSIQNQIDAVVVSAFGSDETILFKQMQELGIEKPILSDKGVCNKAFLDAIGELAEGVVYTESDYGKDSNPEFWNKYNEKFKEFPTIFSAQGYDTFKIIYSIIGKDCRSGDSTCIKDNLYKIENYSGAAGLTTFDKNGDAIKEIVIKTIKNGQCIKYEE